MACEDTGAWGGTIVVGLRNQRGLQVPKQRQTWKNLLVLAHPLMLKLVEGGSQREPFTHILCGKWHFDKNRCATLSLQVKDGVRVKVPLANSQSPLSSSEKPPCSPSLGTLSHIGFWEATSLPGVTDKQRLSLKNSHVNLRSTLVTPGNFLRQEATQFATS